MRWPLNRSQQTKQNQVFELPDLLLSAQKIAQNLYSGTHGRKKSGIGERFWQFRDYVIGDDPRRIDWRQSAKTSHIFIREQEWEAAQTAYIWIDSREAMFTKTGDARHSKYEAATLMALSLSKAMMQAGENIGMLNHADFRPGHSEKKFFQLGHHLMNMKPIKDDKLDKLTLNRRHQNSCVVLFTDGWDDLNELGTQLSLLKKQVDQILFVQINDPLEVLLDVSGSVRFSPFSGEDNMLFQNVHDIREAYHQKVEAHLNALNALCKALHIRQIYHRTDQDILKPIHQAWQQLGGLR